MPQSSCMIQEHTLSGPLCASHWSGSREHLDRGAKIGSRRSRPELCGGSPLATSVADARPERISVSGGGCPVGRTVGEEKGEGRDLQVFCPSCIPLTVSVLWVCGGSLQPYA